MKSRRNGNHKTVPLNLPSLSGREKLLEAHERTLELYFRALAARERAAVSYRGFLVGAAGLAVKSSAPEYDRYHIFTGGNTKVVRSDDTHCAEPKVWDQAIATRCDEMLVMLIAAQPQQEEGSDKMYKTLHPCKRCRQKMLTSMRGVGRHSRLIRPYTLIICVSPETREMERFTVAELMQIHNEPY